MLRLRLAPALLALALPVGCTGRTAPLPIQGLLEDGGASPLDAGALDVGVPDAGPVDTGEDPGPVDAGPGNRCAFEGDYTQQLTIVAEGQQFYDGLARVLSRSPLDVETRDFGEVVRIDVGQAPLPDIVQPGAAIWLQFARVQPQWVNAAVAIREIAPNDGPGALRLAVWRFGEEAGEIDFGLETIDVRYEPDVCAPNNITSCGPVRTESLIVSGPAVGEVRIGTGQRQSFRTFRAANGRSFRYPDFPQCTDTPSFWYEGYIAVF